VLSLRVDLLASLGRPEEAARLLDAAAAAHERQRGARARQARAAYLAQAARALSAVDPAEGAARLAAAYEADPSAERLEEWLSYARAHHLLRDRAAATRALARTLEADPKSARRRGRLLVALADECADADPALSASLYQDALAAVPDDYDAAERLSEVALAANLFEPLAFSLERVLPLCLEGEFRGRLALRLAFTLCALGRHDESRAALARALEDLAAPLEEEAEAREVVQWGRARCPYERFEALAQRLKAAGLQPALRG